MLLVATEVEPERAYEALVAGAGGYLSREASAAELCAAIADVAAGRTVLAPAAQTAIAAEIVSRGRGERALLTPRQVRILQLLAEGRSAAEIATRLQISHGTAKADLGRVYQRLGVSDRAAAVAIAMRRGLIR